MYMYILPYMHVQRQNALQSLLPDLMTAYRDPAMWWTQRAA